MTLGEVCTGEGASIQTGPFGSQLHAYDYVEVGLPVVMPVNIGDNRIVETNIARISPTEAERLRRHALAEGDIVYSRRGDVERRALVRKHEVGWLCGTGCLRVRANRLVVDDRFLSYHLGHPETRAWILQHAVGATMPNLSTSILKDIPISVPLLSEQRAIADMLSTLDDKIESNRRVCGIATHCMEGLGAALAHLPTTPLSQLIIASREIIDPSTLTHHAVEHFSIPAFDANGMPDLALPSSIKSDKFAISGPRVLVSRLNPATPRVWFAVPSSGVALGSTEFLVLSPTGAYSSAIVWLAVTAESFTSEMMRRATGTSGSHQRIRPADALAIDATDTRLADPAILDEADALLHRAHQARVESRTLAALRDALLPELLSGRLRVPEAREQVEAVV